MELTDGKMEIGSLAILRETNRTGSVNTTGQMVTTTKGTFQTD